MTEREFAVDVVRKLQNAGYQALWAGGCVRDELLGLAPKDYDVATNARPEEVQRLFRRTIAVGMSFGVIEVLGPRHKGGFIKVQVATFRSDCAYSDGRHPDAVVFSSAKEDALRRDFTINGMFFDPINSELLDYVGGKRDLNEKTLRAIGAPAERFAEDKLRLLRAVRMATRFDLEIEPTTAAAIKKMAPEINVVSAERLAEELRQLLVHRQRVRGALLLDELELLPPIFQELLPLKELSNPHVERSDETLWEHTLAVLGFLKDPSVPLAFAALLHEIGLPHWLALSNTEQVLVPHETIGKQMAAVTAQRLRMSNAERDGIVWLIERHRALESPRTTRLSKLKPLLGNAGIRELLALHRAESLALGRSVDHVEYCEGLLQKWTKEDLDPAPLITGEDLKKLGLKPGPMFKKILDAVRDEQLDENIHTKEEALRFAAEFVAKQNSNREQA